MPAKSQIIFFSSSSFSPAKLSLCFVFLRNRFPISLSHAAGVLALVHFCLRDEFAVLVIDHDSRLVVVAHAFFPACVDIGSGLFHNACLVSGRLLRTSVEFILYRVTKLLQGFHRSCRLFVHLQNNLDVLIRGLGRTRIGLHLGNFALDCGQVRVIA